MLALERALAEFIGVAQHSLCIAIYVGFFGGFFGLKSLYRSFYLTSEWSALLYWSPKGMTAGLLPGFHMVCVEECLWRGKGGV